MGIRQRKHDGPGAIDATAASGQFQRDTPMKTSAPINALSIGPVMPESFVSSASSDFVDVRSSRLSWINPFESATAISPIPASMSIW